MSSIYDQVQIGSLVIEPEQIHADYVTVALRAVIDEPGVVPLPYVQDGVVHIPVRMWESMQEAMT